MEIIDTSAKELWKKGLNYILNEGIDFKDQNGRICREVNALMMRLTDFKDVDYPIESLSHISDWIYPRLSEMKSIILEGKLAKSYVYSYGERVFSYSKNAINQMDDFVIPLLKKNPSSRKAVITLWNPEKDAKPEAVISPGLVVLDFKLRDNKLIVFALVRSNDIFIGWPANLYQLYVLGEYICKKIHCKMGSITTCSTSAHVFEENRSQIQKLV